MIYKYSRPIKDKVLSTWSPELLPFPPPPTHLSKREGNKRGAKGDPPMAPSPPAPPISPAPSPAPTRPGGLMIGGHIDDEVLTSAWWAELPGDSAPESAVRRRLSGREDMSFLALFVN